MPLKDQAEIRAKAEQAAKEEEEARAKEDAEEDARVKIAIAAARAAKVEDLKRRAAVQAKQILNPFHPHFNPISTPI